MDQYGISQDFLKHQKTSWKFNAVKSIENHDKSTAISKKYSKFYTSQKWVVECFFQVYCLGNERKTNMDVF